MILLLVWALCMVVSAGAQNKSERAILSILQAQADQWNKGNIEGYMHGYWENDSLLFIGSSGPRHGYANTLKRYKEAYPDQAHMGTLTSTVTKMTRLSARYYFVVGKWALARSAGNISGSYTLLFHKIRKHWVIVADHSS